MTMAKATATPRFHHQWLPDQIQFEPGALGAEEQAALVARGHTLKPLAEPYGNLQVVIWRPATDAVEAAADPRWIASGGLTRARPQ